MRSLPGSSLWQLGAAVFFTDDVALAAGGRVTARVGVASLFGRATGCRLSRMAALAPASRQTAIAAKARRNPMTVRGRIRDILMAHAKNAKLAKIVPLSVLCVLGVSYSFGT